MIAFFFCMFVFYFGYSEFLSCLVYFFSFAYSCLFPIFVQVHRPLSSGGNPIAINKYHIIFHKTATHLRRLPYYSLKLFYRLLRPTVFKIQHISDTESHAIQVGQAYNSVRFYLFIRSVSLATTIGPVRITFCRRKVM